MKGVFKGVYRNKGSFTDEKTGEYIEYDKAEFTILTKFKQSRRHIQGIGEEAAQKMACPWANLAAVCNTDDLDDGATTFDSELDFVPFLGHRVRVDRDQYGNLEELSFIE